MVTPREVRIGVGGAITALADAAAEIEETRVKARALLAALPPTELAASRGAAAARRLPDRRRTSVPRTAPSH